MQNRRSVFMDIESVTIIGTNTAKIYTILKKKKTQHKSIKAKVF